MAQELMVLKPELQKNTGNNVIGFPDLISQQKEDASFAPLTLENGFKAMAGGDGGGTRNTPEGNVTAMFGDLQAASELSLDELAKQTELLEDIKDNTDPKVDTAGGQKPPKTEEEIKKKLEGDEEEITEEQGNKIIKLLDEANGSTANLAMFMSALGGSIAATKMTGEELTSGLTKALIAAGVLTAASTAAKVKMTTKAVQTNQKVPDDKDKDKKNNNKKNNKPKTNTPKTNNVKKLPVKPPVGSQIVKKGSTFAAKTAARAAATAASGPLAPVVGGVALAATVYDLGTMALEAAGYGEQVEAFETGAMNLVGIETDEQEAEKDAEKIAMNTKQLNALVPQSMNDVTLDDEQKQKAIKELEVSLANSGDVDLFGDREARIADRTFAKFERKYGEVDLSQDYAPVTPMSADQIETQTTDAQLAEALSLQPIVNVPQQPTPNVNIPPSPQPNINVSAILPRTNLPRDFHLTGSQSYIPKFVVE